MNADGNREFNARELDFGTGEEFPYFECGACGSLLIAEVPADIGRLYPADYYSFNEPRPPRGAGLKRRLKLARTRLVLGWPRPLAGLLAAPPVVPDYLRWLGRMGLTTSARILDVGCGSGSLLATLRSWGFNNLAGVDPFIAGDIEFDGVHIRRATLPEIGGSYELLIFNHSFEHLPDPQDALAEARQRLAPGGWVLLRMPVAGSLAWRTYGTDWVALDAPRHLCIPSERGMTLLAERCGFAVHRVEFDSTARQFWGSEQNRLGISYLSERSCRNNPAVAPFTARQIAKWERQARRLNAAHDGDCAAFLLQCR